MTGAGTAEGEEFTYMITLRGNWTELLPLTSMDMPILLQDELTVIFTDDKGTTATVGWIDSPEADYSPVCSMRLESASLSQSGNIGDSFGWESIV